MGIRSNTRLAGLKLRSSREAIILLVEEFQEVIKLFKEINANVERALELQVLT
jgi:hypothetical protein